MAGGLISGNADYTVDHDFEMALCIVELLSDEKVEHERDKDHSIWRRRWPGI
jgi:hypothetical protein